MLPEASSILQDVAPTLAGRLVYLATPYQHRDDATRRERFEQACGFAARLFDAGVLAFAPVTQSHLLREFGGGGAPPRRQAAWRSYARLMLERCEVLLVYQIPGWATSAEVRWAITTARDTGKPILYVRPD